MLVLFSSTMKNLQDYISDTKQISFYFYWSLLNPFMFLQLER